MDGYDFDVTNFAGAMRKIDAHLLGGLSKDMERNEALYLAQQATQYVRQECERVYAKQSDAPIWACALVMWERIVQQGRSVEKALKLSDGKWAKMARKRYERYETWLLQQQSNN